MESLLNYIKYGSRSLFKQSGFAAITIVTLALGIGANTAIFSLLNAVLFRPLPFPGADRLAVPLQWPGGVNGFLIEGRQYAPGRGGRGFLAVVLLIGAGLLIQSLMKLRGQYSALKPESVLTIRTVLARGKYSEQSQRLAFYKQVLNRVKALPGVVSAGYTTSVPLVWKGGTNGFSIEGRSVEQATAEGLSYEANHRQVSADYLKTMGIQIVQGHSFDETDNEQSIPLEALRYE